MTPKNWKNFQHYTDRKPTWIKLHRALLDDYQYSCLPLASQALAPRLWLLASEYEDGNITANLDEMAFRLHVQRNDLIEAIKPLVRAGFFVDDSGLLAGGYQTAIPERERERETQVQTETETETELRSLRSREPEKVHRETISKDQSDWPSDFREQFWSTYPRKTERLAAMKALEKVHKTAKVPWEKLIGAVRRYAATADPTFTKHPTTWLNKGCWDDQPGGSNGAGISNKTRQSGGSDFFAGLAAVAADIDGNRSAPRPEAAEVPFGRVNIDL